MITKRLFNNKTLLFKIVKANYKSKAIVLFKQHILNKDKYHCSSNLISFLGTHENMKLKTWYKVKQ